MVARGRGAYTREKVRELGQEAGKKTYQYFQSALKVQTRKLGSKLNSRAHNGDLRSGCVCVAGRARNVRMKKREEDRSAHEMEKREKYLVRSEISRKEKARIKWMLVKVEMKN